MAAAAKSPTCNSHAMASSLWTRSYRFNPNIKIANRFPQFFDWLSPEGHGFPQFAVPFSILVAAFAALCPVKNQDTRNNGHATQRHGQINNFIQKRRAENGAHQGNNGPNLT
eukprot:NODE_11660_length_460_cov_0.741742_g11637_i0.p1 GENE.NODE_11660_length_460_cov_0.741742_g11637_i0~~NODE_11660_length_460_cov_0.741742_g11637_i0.p1  ORF type:complete len:112 (+),score=3.55 NODE_11660_length_460_cov_0.741742_g11637_i0:98-433(+)